MKDENEFEIPWLGIVLTCIAVGLALFLLTGAGYINLKTWGPKIEDARRETFTHSTAYVQGKAQYLSRLRLEWDAAEPSHKGTLCATARHEASTVDIKLMPEDVQAFIKECDK